MIKVTVDRERWLRGEGPEDSALLRTEDNKMCCLGFVCLALGVSESTMAGIPSPDFYIDIEYGGQRAAIPQGLVSQLLGPSHTVLGRRKMLVNSRVADAMVANDDHSLSDEAREAIIKDALLNIDIHVEFVGPKENVNEGP